MNSQVNHSFGSSPQMRGSTEGILQANPTIGDHPRRCGGARIRGDCFELLVGIIPADAGSTCRRCASYCCVRDHPRRYGEHDSWITVLCILAGSSPQMRGAPLQRLQNFRQERIIPADAGSTNFGVIGLDGVQDHPRRCGEHSHLVAYSCRVAGSSPQMRGAPFDGHAVEIILRIIPADAGSTENENLRRENARDHPRRCGEHICLALLLTGLLGSSPQMRGARQSGDIGSAIRGIIPADAGSTQFTH